MIPGAARQVRKDKIAKMKKIIYSKMNSKKAIAKEIN